MLVQVNARVPVDGREAMLSVAAKLRDDARFATRLLAFIEDDAGGSPWADRFAALEDRVRMLEELGKRSPENSGDHPPEGFSPDLAETTREVEPAAVAGAVESAPVAATVVQRCSNEHWSARAAAITVSTGEGKGKKLTTEGIAMFEEMAHAGVPAPTMAKLLDMADQSVRTRLAKLKARE